MGEIANLQNVEYNEMVRQETDLIKSRRIYSWTQRLILLNAHR